MLNYFKNLFRPKLANVLSGFTSTVTKLEKVIEHQTELEKASVAAALRHNRIAQEASNSITTARHVIGKIHTILGND